ncbi:MAG: CAP domain-containing protein [Desulfobulbaceae bacterium]|nr:CAP domain-containing protein [Desulfobulbaceae bacterium]
MFIKCAFGIMIMSMLSAGAGSVLSAEEGVMTGMTEAHNAVRAELGLPELAWSDELAESAGEWAQYLADYNGCRMKHRPAKGENASDYGENLFRASAVKFSTGEREVQKFTAQHVVDSWASEAQYYNYEKNRCQWGRKCGHYKQVVWRDTRLVGCGMALCADKSQIWVCNYDPPGNFAGRKPY